MAGSTVARFALCCVASALATPPPRGTVASEGPVQSEPWRPPIHSVAGRRLSAPEQPEALARHGVWLKAVHAHRLEADRLVHLRHEVDEPPAAATRRLAYNGTTRRDLVKLLWKLSMVCYGTDNAFSKKTMKPILDAGESLFGESVTTYQAELDAQIAAMNARISELQGIGSYSTADGGLGIDTSPKGSTGVHALEFHAAGLGTVLAFRGSYSTGDVDNIKPWLTKWVLSRMNAQMKNQWITEAAQVWTDAMASRANDTADEKMVRSVGTMGSGYMTDNFLKTMAKLAQTKGLDKDKVAKTGYWEFTKVIANAVESSLKLGVGEEFYLTGHSQGGSRAALVSMYFEKSSNGTKKYQTITFAANGGACFARDLMFTSGNFLDDVDPYIHHDQVTDYAHVLDTFGNFDHDVGNVCLYGKTGLASSMVKKYCEVIQGHSGPRLIVAGQAGLHPDLEHQFNRCLYFAHSPYAISIALENEAFLSSAGDTDYGCNAAEVIPEGDPKGRCPTDDSMEEDGCEDELSCGACMATRPSGTSCHWCAETSTCRPAGHASSNSCPTGWIQGEISNCSAAFPGSGSEPEDISRASVRGSLGSPTALAVVLAALVALQPSQALVL